MVLYILLLFPCECNECFACIRRTRQRSTIFDIDRISTRFVNDAGPVGLKYRCALYIMNNCVAASSSKVY